MYVHNLNKYICMYILYIYIYSKRVKSESAVLTCVCSCRQPGSLNDGRQPSVLQWYFACARPQGPRGPKEPCWILQGAAQGHAEGRQGRAPIQLHWRPDEELSQDIAFPEAFGRFFPGTGPRICGSYVCHSVVIVVLSDNAVLDRYACNTAFKSQRFSPL